MHEMTNTSSHFERLSGILAASGSVAYEWDMASDAIVWFNGALDAFGIASHDAIATGERFKTLICPEDLAFRQQTMSLIYRGSENYDLEYRVRCAGGEHRWFHDHGSAEVSASGKLQMLRGVLRPLTDRKINAGRLDFLANYDALTGQYNRSRLRESIDHALQYSQRYNVEGALLAIGIDKLTVVNQAFGHEIADSVILAIGDQLDRCLRASDVVGRIGGDKFGAILVNCPESELRTAAEKILETARNTVVDTPAGPIHVTVSVGAVNFPSKVGTAADAMTKADIALRDAKQLGRDCFVIYDCTEQQQKSNRESMVIAERVQRAIRENRLRFAYQPVVDAHTHRISHYECLLRMIEPDGSVTTAARFMPAVEDLGMIRPIDRMVLEAGIQELSKNPAARIALNVSGLTTTDRSWMRGAIALLRDKREIASRLMVEITETAGLEDVDACARFVATLRDLGCRVALDDFGAGYTSFRHLKMLAVDMVKIDGSFIQNIGANPDNLVFVRTLIDLAHNFNLETVAEGVETQEDAVLLAREGIDFLQGYAFGRPELDIVWPVSPAEQPVRVALIPGLSTASS
jgi:diguanylate cyclase (GGDEF)-like protein